MSARRTGSAVVVLALVLGLFQTLIGASASQAAIAQPAIVSANPQDNTPYVLDGSVRALVQVGNKVIVGGTFSQVKEFGTGKPTLTRNNIFAFNPTTGVVDTAFNPNANGLVAALAVSADGLSVYVGGAFTTIGGVGPRSIARLNVSNGARTAGFTPPAFDSQIKDIKRVGNALYAVGTFGYVAGVNTGPLATLNATTGARTTIANVKFTGAHNGGITQILKIDVSPAGDRLVAIGNFNKVDGVTRDQFAMLNITPSAATLGWYTPFYEGACASVFESYMRDLDFSPDGSFFVISTTGAYGGSTGPCDLTARFETYSSSGDSVMPSWRNYTGGDTTYAVAITGSVVYVGGHQRWQNNPYAGDRVGPGAVSRPGVAALDPTNGLPFSWNPTRDTGVGIYDFLATPTGLWAGNDTLNIGGEYHPRLAFFPLAGGTAIPANLTGSLPNDVYLTGRTANAVKPSILYRINAGGQALASADDGPDWAADDQFDSAYRNSGSNAAGWSPVANVDGTVTNSDTDRAPRALFDSERWSPGNPEMSWAFPVPAGQQIQVRLFFANRYDGTSGVGGRVFNVDLNGNRVLNNYDIVADVGHNTGTMKSWNLTSTGSVNIDFSHVNENPLINGIEIVRTDLPPNPVSNTKDDVQRHYFTGSFSDPAVTLSNTGPAWGNSRGSMLIDGKVYFASTNGNFYSTTFDGTTFGTPVQLDLYGGYFGGEASSVTGMFFDNGRMYFTLAGDNTLHYRYFTPESGVVGAIRYDAVGPMGDFQGNRVSGMFKAGGKVYFADSSTGNLMSMDFANNTLSGSVSLADSTADWRSRGMFVWNGTPKPRVGTPPSAVATVTCTYLSCDFSSAGSSDVDGSITGYSWNFDDTTSSTSASGTHVFSAPGTYSVTLTVTDDASQTGTATQVVTVDQAPNVLPTASSTVNCTYLSCAVNGSASSDSDGTIASYAWDFGDTTSSTLASTTHVFANPGTYDIALTVTDNRGGTDVKTTTVTVAANQAPTAAVSVTCTNLTCANSSAGTSDSDGTIASYAWSFGDTTNSTAVSPSHTYAVAGTYTVSLTVTDNGGLTSTATQEVTVTAPALSSPIAFVGSRNAQANAATTSIQAPAGLQAGQSMLLFATTNTTATINSLTGGWTYVGERLAGDGAGDMRTRLYTKVATAGDVGSTSVITLAATSKTDLTVLAYSGTDATSPVLAWASAKETATTATHATPSVALTEPRAWAVSYWADKANVTAGFGSAPAGTTQRSAAFGSGGGRISTLVADNAAPVGFGSSYGSLSAVAASATYKATMWTVILRPTP